MSKAIELRNLLIIPFVIAMAPLVHAGTALETRGGTFVVNGSIVNPVHYRRGLESFVKSSHIFLVPKPLGGGRYLVLVRQPTRRLPMHRCGAGFEDFLAMVRLDQSDIILLDKIRLQSCDQSISLDLPDSLDADKIISALKVEQGTLRFSVVRPTSRGDLSAPEEHRFLLMRDRFLAQ